MDLNDIDSVFIRKNTPELREKIEKSGLGVCTCAYFEDSIWLHSTYLDVRDRLSGVKEVHGLGYGIQEKDDTPETVVNGFLEDIKSRKNNTTFDCGTNEDLFIELALYREDTDLRQLFILEGTDRIERSSEEVFYGRKLPISSWRKLTKNEIVILYG